MNKFQNKNMPPALAGELKAADGFNGQDKM